MSFFMIERYQKKKKPICSIKLSLSVVAESKVKQTPWG